MPSPRLTGLPAYLTTHSQRSASNHVMQPRYRFTRHIPAYRASFGLRHRIAGSSLHTAESSSLYCGPPVRLRLLSTPPHGDAVTFDYRALAYPDTDFHCANVAPSRAHNSRLPALDGKLVGKSQQKKTAHLVIDSAKNHTSVDFRVDQNAPDTIASPAYPIRLTARFAMQKHPTTARFDASWRFLASP